MTASLFAARSGMYVVVVLIFCIIACFLFSFPNSPLTMASDRLFQKRAALENNPYFSQSAAIAGTGASGDNDYSSWMSRLSDATYMTNINMIGTHDSTARFGSESYLCQSLSLPDQLSIGVRVFDIRLALTQGGLRCQHGRVDQNIDFAEVLHIMDDFLTQHPTEAVFLKIQQEHSRSAPQDFSSSVSAALVNRAKIFNAPAALTADTIPTMGALRGKIMIIPRSFSLSNIHTLPYEYATVQDDFKVSEQDKVRAILDFYNSVVASTTAVSSVANASNSYIQARGLHRHQSISAAQLQVESAAKVIAFPLYINHFSLHNDKQSPAQAASIMNPLVTLMVPSDAGRWANLANNPFKSQTATSAMRRRSTLNSPVPTIQTGVLLMDFVGVESTRIIIESNFS